MLKSLFPVICLICLITMVNPCNALPAFPGAEGWGAETPGGRGGRVIQVTNLEDSGPGSFREACSAEGPRIVVFRVGGTIELKSALVIKHPYITIAGQTAPGGGIGLRNAPFRIVTHDVVVRFIRARIGASRIEDVDSMDTVWVGGDRNDPAHHVIIDHCSFSWSQDEVASAVNGASHVIYSWCLISEGLRTPFPGEVDEDGAERRHAYAVMLGNNPNQVSFHHNFVSNCDHRNPRIQGGTHQFVNNVFYNWGYLTGTFSRYPKVNFINNFYKPGPSSKMLLPVTEKEEDLGQVYVKGNLSPFRPKDSLPDWENTVNAPPEGHRAEEPFPAPPITTTDAWRAYWEVLAAAGATLPKRDAVDERLIHEARTGGGRIIDRPEDVGGYPDLAGGTAPDDTDLDGMPDDWEKAQGLNPQNPADAAAAAEGGYTNIEIYLNILASQAPRFNADETVIPLTSAFSTVKPPEPAPLIKSHGKPVFPMALQHLEIKEGGPDLPAAGINCRINGIAPAENEISGIESIFGFFLVYAQDRLLVRHGDETAMNRWAEELTDIAVLKDRSSCLGVIGPDFLIDRIAAKHSLPDGMITTAWPKEALDDLAREIGGVFSGRRMLEKSAGSEVLHWLNLGMRTDPGDVARFLHPACVDVFGIETADLTNRENWVTAIRDRARALVASAGGRPVYAVINPAVIHRKPKDNAIRTLALSAVLGGARGIHWLEESAGDKYWPGVKKVSQDLNQLAPYFLEGTPMPVRSADARVIAAGWACSGNRQAILAINTTGESIPAGRISLEGSWSGESAYVLPTGESLSLLNDPAGCVDVSLKPYEAVIITNTRL